MAWARRKGNKYGVAPAEDRTCDGIVFHSKKEMLAYRNQFRPLMRTGFQVELQKRYLLFASEVGTADGIGVNLRGRPIKIGEYVADFVVTEKDGTVRVYDVKGVSTPEYKLKKRIFEACYPSLRIVEL